MENAHRKRSKGDSLDSLGQYLLKFLLSNSVGVERDSALPHLAGLTREEELNELLKAALAVKIAHFDLASAAQRAQTCVNGVLAHASDGPPHLGVPAGVYGAHLCCDNLLQLQDELLFGLHYVAEVSEIRRLLVLIHAWMMEAHRRRRTIFGPLSPSHGPGEGLALFGTMDISLHMAVARSAFNLFREARVSVLNDYRTAPPDAMQDLSWIGKIDLWAMLRLDSNLPRPLCTDKMTRQRYLVCLFGELRAAAGKEQVAYLPGDHYQETETGLDYGTGAEEKKQYRTYEDIRALQSYQRAAKAGHVSFYRLAQLIGRDRHTIRNWVNKKPGFKKRWDKLQTKSEHGRKPLKIPVVQALELLASSGLIQKAPSP